MAIQNAPFIPLNTYARTAPNGISDNSGRVGEPVSSTSTSATTQAPAVTEVTFKSNNTEIIPPWQNKGSSVWVSYQHGINLAEAREPGSSKSMSPQDLIALPSQLREEAVTEEQERLITTAMVGPVVEWAVANNVLAKRENYSNAEIQQAFLALENIHDETATAVASLTRHVPMRKNYYTGTQSVSPIKGHADPHNKQYLTAKYDDEEFIEDFKSDLANKQSAYKVLIKQVLSTLPLEDRVAVERGEVTLYALKAQGSEDDLARSSFFLKSVHEGKTTFIEVNPGEMTARRRDDLQSILNGSKVVGKKKLADGSFSEELSVMERPNIQNSKHLSIVERERANLLNNEVFSAKLYGLQELAVIPSVAGSSNADNVPPNTFSSQRSNTIADTITEKLFYVKELDLLQLAQDDPDRVTPEEKEDRKNYKEFYEERERRRSITYGILKGFVPLYNSIEAFVEGKPLEGLGYLLMDILGMVSPPVGKIFSGALRKGLSMVPSAIKSPFNNAARYLNKVASYTPRQLKPNVAHQGGVPGVKWTSGASPDADTLTNQFKANMKSVPADAAHSHPVEFNGRSYFVQNKADAGDGVHYLLRLKDPHDHTKLVSSGIVAKQDATGAWKRRGVQGGAPLSESMPTTFTPASTGNTINDLNIIGDGIHTFKSNYKGMSRLNIQVHGEVPSGHGYHALINGRRYSPEELLALLKSKGVDPEKYGSVRLLTCYSGNGGAESFGSRFQKLINKPVKAFEEPILTNFTTEHMTAARDRIVKILKDDISGFSKEEYERAAAIIVQNDLNGKNKLFINKADGAMVDVNVASAGEPPRYIKVINRYRPVYFQ